MKFLILADDLSGAADCAIGFAAAGHFAVVALDAKSTDEFRQADTVAIDTDTRRCAPVEAAARSVAAYSKLGGGRRLYKKIDSTLRGNWAAEVAALQPFAGLALVAPAFPATGRVVRNGRVYVKGMPLEETGIWKLENEGRPADVRTLLAASGLSCSLFDAEAFRDRPEKMAARFASQAEAGMQALVVDAQSEETLRVLARVTMQSDAMFFWVGSGGLAREIAALDPHPMKREARADAGFYPPVLAVVGSLSEVSERQCRILCERGGIEEVVVDPSLLRCGPEDAGWRQLQESIGHALGAHRDLVLRIGRDERFDPTEGTRLAEALAALLQPHLQMVGGLIATGGETARALLRAAGIASLQMLDEVEAGVALSRPLGADGAAGPTIVTKAGAFGTDQALYSAWRQLRNKPGRIPPH
ncbi:MAG: four-carbon acid sugar kinase family protein [Terracidiphilus sp.]